MPGFFHGRQDRQWVLARRHALEGPFVGQGMEWRHGPRRGVSADERPEASGIGDGPIRAQVLREVSLPRLATARVRANRILQGLDLSLRESQRLTCKAPGLTMLVGAPSM